MFNLPRWIAVLLLLGSVSTANAQGFTLNPFTKKEPEPDAVRRTLSDTPPPAPAENSGLQFPKLSFPKLPTPQLPSWKMPQLPGMGGGSSMNAPRPRGPQKPGMLQQWNQNTAKFFKNTSDFVTYPIRSLTGQTSTPQATSSHPGAPVRQASATRKKKPKQGGGLFQLPNWLGGGADDGPPPEPRTVGDFLNQKRPGFDQ